MQKQDDQRGRCSRSPGYMYSHLKYDKEMCVLKHTSPNLIFFLIIFFLHKSLELIKSYGHHLNE